MKKINGLIFSLALLILFPLRSFNQDITQVVKGKVFDEDTRSPLPGATIVLPGTNPLIGTISDANGNFRIEKVPVGRYYVKVSFIGFETYNIRELLVGSGKEVVLNIGMKESAINMDEVEIKASGDAKEPLNSMAVLSARQINMEEARRYAGGYDDPAHLAASFAGVADNMSSNGIVIRGNAPSGLLWRMEGIEISNPSHFANLSTFGGGGITALSSQMLANSDFYTGAFPAEYGNALSGVFDLKLRTGNPDRREYTIQAGLTGVDLSAEGPFVKGRPSTFLFNYRYSIFALLGPLLPENAELIKYQDLCFKLDFPTKKTGTWSLWGLGGNDFSGEKPVNDSMEWQYDRDRNKTRSFTSMGAMGIENRFIAGKKTFVFSTLSASGNAINSDGQKLDFNYVLYDNEKIDDRSWKYSLAAYVNHKFGPRHINRSGFDIDLLNYNLYIAQTDSLGAPLTAYTNEKGKSILYQAYSESRLEVGSGLTLNLGLHAQYFALNGKYSLEPRAALKWNVSPISTLSFAYGLHSRLEMLNTYLASAYINDALTKPNKNLDFTRAHHFVAGYYVSLNENISLKTEIYYQYLFDVPVIPDSSFSMLNMEHNWFLNIPMTNSGTGRNMGIDITLERYMSHGFYYIVAVSLFDSKYTGGDGIERNSRYNKNYIVHVLGGKEWRVGKNRNNLLSVNGKLSLLGGDRISPVDVALTDLYKEVVYDEYRAFEDRKPAIQYLHMGINYKINKQKHSGTWSLQVFNALGAKEFYGYKYNLKYNTIDPDTDLIILPSISYKIEF